MGPQEDYIETVFTCEGDFHDPHLKDRLEDFQKSLKDLLLTDKNKLILKKVEPWNSVRVTFKIPREAALRLKQLAQQGNSTLRELGVLTVKIQDQNISLTIAGRNNECTRLVFRTAESSQETTPSLSLYGTNSPLDELEPQGPGPSHIETASKSIAEYLQQGPALLDFFSQHAAGEKILGPQCDLARMKINNILSERDIQNKSLLPAPTQSGHHGLALSLSANSLCPNRSPVGQDGLRFPQVSGLSPGFSSGSSGHGLDNLPPPYPEGSSYMNSLQKLHLSSTGPSPLLVNLLQNDPNFSNLLAAGRHTPSLGADCLQPPKKKRKPRKPREKKKVAEQHVSNIEKPGFTGPAAETNSMSSQMAPSVTNSSFMNLESNVAISEHVFKTVAQAVMHKTHVQSKSEQMVSLTNIATLRRPDDCDTTGKIINPVTGLLEPMENLSDTSPAKSDGGKHSPHSLAQGATGTVENSFQSPLGEGNNVVGYPVGPLHPNQGNQRMISDHTNSVSLSPGQTMQFVSSHFGSNPCSDLLRQKYLDEVVTLEMAMKTRLKNDVMSPINKVDQTLSYCASKNSGIVDKMCDKSSADDLQGKNETGDKKKEVVPQESDTKSIPVQLLNKPLLQVKHESVTGKPPGSSPDSNIDSECLTQSFNLDTHNGSDPGGQSGPQMDLKTYNNDSGVGSCSERSDDTPSDPGDCDYKSGNTNLIECAKPSLVEPLQQGLSNSTTVAVGYVLTDTQKDIKNHKIVSPFLGSDKLLNSSLDKTFKTEKLDTYPTSQSHPSNCTIEEQLRLANNVDPVLKQAVHDSINRKSPKLSAPLPKSLHHGKDSQPNSMQGHTEPLSMRKKASPRSSPRSSSPRTPGSPRNTSSPRGSSSPRTVDPIIAGPSHQAFLELSAHIPGRESQNKSPYNDQCKTLYSEQRKSPYNMMSTPHSAFSPEMLNPLGTHWNSVDSRMDRNYVGMETFMGLPQQCNTDTSLLKSLEAARQLNLLAATKNAMCLKKMEPKFQKFQQMNMIHSMANDVENLNRVDNVNHTSRSPGLTGHLSKNNGPNSIGMDVHTDIAVLQNCGNAGPLSIVNTSSNSDRDNSLPKTNSKGSKLHSEELKGATNSTSRRSSPGVASNTSNPLHHSYDSTLPQPKRLTESVQKLLTLPLLDNHSRPHVNRRSPSSSASATKLTSIATGALSVSNSRGSVSLAPFVTSSRNPTGESSHIDLNSITPSIMGFGLGSLDFHLDTSCHSHSDIANIEHFHEPSVDYHPVDVSHPSVVSSIPPTQLVPVFTGVVPFSKPGDSVVLSNVSEPHISAAGNHNGSNIQIPVVSEQQEIACNSDSKMADSNVIESKSLSSQVCSTQCGPPMLQPQNVWYPVHKHSEQLKSPYQQMGNSEMLQVTASLHSLTGKLSPSLSISEKALSSQTQKASSTDTDKSSKTPTRYVKNLEFNLEPHCCQSSSVNESKQSVKCDIGNVTAKSPENRDNSDIPKLKRQTSVLNTKSFNFNATAISSTLCDSDLDKSQDSYSSNNSTPPVLTAESVELENNSEHAVMVQNDIVSEASNNHVTVGCSEPDNTNFEKSFKSNLSKTEENAVEEHTLQTPILVRNPLNPNSEHLRYPVPEISEALDNVINVLATAEGVEERLEDSGVVPRQLRSRKRTTELDINAHDDSKRIKLDSSPETSTKFESAKEPIKVQGAKLNSSVSSLHDVKAHEDNFHRESVKSGLRARTNSKNLSTDDREKTKQPSGRESHKDGKVVSGKPINQKSKAVKVEDSKRNQHLRCNRQSSSVASPAKQFITPATRDKSPVCASIARCHNLPVVMDTNEDFLENKRTTRSAKCKATKGDQSNQPQGKTNSANKRRRTTSQDHR